MKFRHVISCGLVLTAIALTGCDEGRTRPRQTNARVVDVAPGFAELQFRRERVNPQQLTFKSVQDFQWDIDTYDFYVLERAIGAGTTNREWTFSRTLSPDVGSYTFVLADNLGEISTIIIENPTESTTEAQVAFVHADVSQPPMDMYLVAPGAGIAGAAPRGTIAPLGQTPYQTLVPGEYEIWLTAVGNPSNVLFASNTVSISAGLGQLIVTPEAGSSTANFSVLVMQAFSTVVYDRNVTAELRVVNGAADTAPRDFAINREFSPPLLPNIAFAAPTAFTTVPIAAEQPINVTPVGNPGVLELDTVLTTLATQRWTLLFSGDAGALKLALALDDLRSIHNEAKLRFFDAAAQFEYLSFIVALPDGDPALYPPTSVLAAPGISDYMPLPEGDYDIYLQSTVTGAMLSGPTRITIAKGGVYSAMAVNGADPSTASLILLDGFN
jgi:hypothetical protein